MGKNKELSETLRQRLEDLFRQGAALQQYIFDIRKDAPHQPSVAEITEELHRLEVRLSIINEMLYQDKMDTRLERAIERFRHQNKKNWTNLNF